MRTFLVLFLSLSSIISSSSQSFATSHDPHRIISLSPSATEDLFAIGAGKSVVAVDSLSNYPRNAPITRLDAYSPNVEAIAKYKPDLVVLQTSANKASAVKTALEKLKIRVFFEVTPTDIQGAYAEINSLGVATGNPSKAAKLVASMKASIAKAISSGKEKIPLSIFHEVDNTLYTATSQTFIGHVYSDFNTLNIANAADTADSGGYPQLTSEYVLKANPAVIFLGDGEPVANVMARAGWGAIDAVANNHVIELPADIPSRWGPRLVNFYQFIATTLTSIKR